MGISNKIEDSKIILCVIDAQFQLGREEKTHEREKPKVVIDANPVGYYFIYKLIGAARGTVCVATELSKAGIDVSIICDN